MLALSEALIFEAGRLTSAAVVILGLLVAIKVLREYIVNGVTAVLTAIIVGGLALWGIVAGPEFFRDQAVKEADAIVQNTANNLPPITITE
jgi:hypothetical protein